MEEQAENARAESPDGDAAKTGPGAEPCPPLTIPTVATQPAAESVTQMAMADRLAAWGLPGGLRVVG